nr:shootin-1-like [Pelodiscus sinensis]|eukprot:XP_014430891.2 shootin-1-like [Pelodiscus sinensis]
MRPPKARDTATDDIKARAVDEMMARIKSGVVLRPARKGPGAVSQDRSAAASKRQSAVMELQGILGTMKRPMRKPSWRRHSQRNKDSQLESILQRRRRMVDSSAPGQPSPLRPELRKTPGVGTAPRVSQTLPSDSDISKAASGPCLEENAAAVQLRERVAQLQKSRRLALLNAARDKPA